MKKLTWMLKYKPAKKKKRVLIFAKLVAEKVVSSTKCQRILKEQKQNSEVFSKLSGEKEARMAVKPLKKRRARERNLIFYNMILKKSTVMTLEN